MTITLPLLKTPGPSRLSPEQRLRLLRRVANRLELRRLEAREVDGALRFVNRGTNDFGPPIPGWLPLLRSGEVSIGESSGGWWGRITVNLESRHFWALVAITICVALAAVLAPPPVNTLMRLCLIWPVGAGAVLLVTFSLTIPLCIWGTVQFQIRDTLRVFERQQRTP